MSDPTTEPTDPPPSAMWRARYFAAYGFTVLMMLLPLLMGHLDGAAYSSAMPWLFGALVGGSAASRAAKIRAGQAPPLADHGGDT